MQLRVYIYYLQPSGSPLTAVNSFAQPRRMTIMRLFLTVISAIAALLLSSAQVNAAHGVGLSGKLKYGPDFKIFDYASSDAQKGGKLILHSIGSFDQMNPYTLKGTAPFGIDAFVFESLGESSLDEPSVMYGLIASDIAIAPDELSVVFTIDPEARFSDGSPLTAKDVAFTLETLKSDKAHPFYSYYYKDIIGSDVLDEKRIRFRFAKANRELEMIACQMPVLSEAYYGKYGFGEGVQSRDILRPPVASGPYVISDVKPGKSITYSRNPDYWAKDHPVRKGMYNFDEITIKYYKDPVVALEAFKAGEFDFMSVNIAKQWVRDMEGDKFSSGKIIKKLVPHDNNAGLQGFLMNTRKSLFTERKVREAMGLAFDFEWTNKSLFFDQYTRSNSFFSNSYLAATGLPTGLELAYLEKFRDQLPPEVFSKPLQAPVAGGPKELRENLQKAKQLLAESGWTIKDGVLKNSAGQPFSFEILLSSATFERVMAPYVKNLEKLGMRVRYRTIDPALYEERLQKFDFDMIVHVYGQSQSPGNEQRNFWHSDAAEQKGSNNYAGIQSAAVDDLVEKIIYAKNQDELTAACKALDRVLWYGYYLVPNWYLDGHRLSYYDKFHQPANLPLYYNYLQLLMTWWAKDGTR
jgi:microcin C transport system substrate-binding protein